MANTFEESKELETLKHDNKCELLDLHAIDRTVEHEQKLIRLNRMLEIAKAGGVKRE